MTELEQKFIDKVMRHDLTYDYSDDHRVWMSGNASWNSLCELAKQLPVEFVKLHWEALVRKSVKDEFFQEWAERYPR